MDQAAAALLLSVDENFANFIDFFQVEVASVKQDLRMRLAYPVASNGDVVAESAPDRRNGLVEHERSRRTLGRKPFQNRHRGEFGSIDSTLKSETPEGLQLGSTGGCWAHRDLEWGLPCGRPWRIGHGGSQNRRDRKPRATTGCIGNPAAAGGGVARQLEEVKEDWSPPGARRPVPRRTQ